MTLTLGRLTLDNPNRWSQNAGGARMVTIGGRVVGTKAEVTRVREQMLGHVGDTVPVLWSEDPQHDGWYRITDVQFQTDIWLNQSVLRYNVGAKRIGSESEVMWETRIIGADLTNDHAVTGETTHAPPQGHYNYSTGATLASTMTRELSDQSSLTVYRNVPDGVNPKWGVALADFYNGACLVEDLSGNVYTGTHHDIDPTDLRISNGLIRLSTLGGQHDLTAEVWDPESNVWVDNGGAEGQFRFEMVAGAWDAATILRNDPEECTVRLQSDTNVGTLGRGTLDLTVRRGERFVRTRLSVDVAAALDIDSPGSTDATADQGGWVSKNANDGNGNRWIIGSPTTFTATSSGIQKASTTFVDALVGVIIGGSGAAAGDAGADLIAQYMAGRAYKDVAVRR